jgi:hypothetical protein
MTTLGVQREKHEQTSLNEEHVIGKNGNEMDILK